MHQSSYDKMMNFRKQYLEDRRDESLRILDVGSMDVNGCYRPIFDSPQWQYQGIDMEPGPNVNIVLGSPYKWTAVRSASADVVISGQAFEHIEYFWITMLEIARVMKPGGIGCIIAPSAGPVHNFPGDCWRFYPDGFIALARFAGLIPLKAETQWKDLDYADGSDVWHDSVIVFQRPILAPWIDFKSRVKRALRHKVLVLGRQLHG